MCAIFSSLLGDIILRLMSLNSQICSLVRTHEQLYLSPASSENPFGVFDYLRTYYPEEHISVTELYNIVERGMWVWHMETC